MRARSSIRCAGAPRRRCIPEGCSGARKRRRGRAHAGELAHEPAGAPAGEGDGRRQGAVAGRAGCAARLPMEVTLDGETLTAAEIKRLAGAVGRAGLHPRQVGRGRSRSAEPHARAIRGDRAPRRRRWPVVRRGHAPAGRRRHRRGCEGRGQADIDWSADRRRALARRDAGSTAPARAASRADPGAVAQGTLRPYQQAGVQWLHLLAQLGLAPALPTTWGSARPSRSCAAAGAQAQTRRADAEPSSWWRRPRCSPTGRRRSRASRRA